MKKYLLLLIAIFIVACSEEEKKENKALEYFPKETRIDTLSDWRVTDWNVVNLAVFVYLQGFDVKDETINIGLKHYKVDRNAIYIGVFKGEKRLCTYIVYKGDDIYIEDYDENGNFISRFLFVPDKYIYFNKNTYFLFRDSYRGITKAVIDNLEYTNIYDF